MRSELLNSVQSVSLLLLLQVWPVIENFDFADSWLWAVVVDAQRLQVSCRPAWSFSPQVRFWEHYVDDLFPNLTQRQVVQKQVLISLPNLAHLNLSNFLVVTFSVVTMVRPQLGREERNWLMMEYNKRRGRRDFVPNLLADFATKFPGAGVPHRNTLANLLKKQVLF